jgi:hypothetical protein
MDMGVVFDHRYEERFQKSCLTRTSDCENAEVEDNPTSLNLLSVLSVALVMCGDRHYRG